MASRPDPDAGLWWALGAIAAIGLGIALIPLRSVTSASNLAFAFVILTIVVAEVGGRAAGLATAVVSALNLNFFLMEPYLTLTITKPDDIVAFAALAVAGLVAAAFGRRRARSSALVSHTRGELEALVRLAEALLADAPLETVLEDVRQRFGLAGLVLRRADGRLAAAVPAAQASLPPPDVALEARTLLTTDASGHRLGPRGFRLPAAGGRLRLETHGQRFWLDLWEGDADGLGVEERRALAAAMAIIGLALATRLEAPAMARS
jgi:hypothetical protein